MNLSCCCELRFLRTVRCCTNLQLNIHLVQPFIHSLETQWDFFAAATWRVNSESLSEKLLNLATNLPRWQQWSALLFLKRKKWDITHFQRQTLPSTSPHSLQPTEGSLRTKLRSNYDMNLSLETTSVSKWGIKVSVYFKWGACRLVEQHLKPPPPTSFQCWKLGGGCIHQFL